MDTAKGIGILLVVYGHVLRGLRSAELVPADHWLLVTDYVIYAFHMPLFFLLSGWMAARSLQRGRASFLGAKFEAIVYPYVLWSLLQGGLTILLAGHTNRSMSFGELLAIAWEPIGQFWFLYALLLCQLVLAAIGTSAARLVAVSVLLFTLGPLYLSGAFLSAAHFFGFYALGVCVGGAKAEYLSGRWAYLLGLVGLFGLSVFIPRLLDIDGGYVMLPAALLGTFAVLLLSVLVDRAGWFGWMGALGRASMPIFLMHVMAGAAVRIVLVRVGITSVVPHLVMGVVMAVTLPMLAYAALSRLGLARLFALPRRTVLPRNPASPQPVGVK